MAISHAIAPQQTSSDLPTLYLDLLKKQLTRAQTSEHFAQIGFPTRRIYAPLRTILARQPLRIVRRVNPQERQNGHDWPIDAETMIGLKRLDNLQHCITEIMRRNVPGDLIETGVWRGGATIFMRAVLKAYGDTTRCVWAADSFQGLPKPNADLYPADAGDEHWSRDQLAISVDQVRANFARYGLLDNQVRFLEGWFKDTLPDAPIEQLSLLRLDGDMYESTMDALRHLYPRLAVGGYVIVDDYGAVPACKAAITDFRAQHQIDDEIHSIDWSGVYWQRTTERG
jgi:O-methyltransferase